MAKRLFQILDEMNVNDGKNNTGTVGVNNALIEAKKAKGGGHITMGVPESVIMDLIFQKNKIPILLIIDKTEYDRIANEPETKPVEEGYKNPLKQMEEGIRSAGFTDEDFPYQYFNPKPVSEDEGKNKAINIIAICPHCEEAFEITNK